LRRQKINQANRSDQVLWALRLVVSGLIAAHGWARWLAGGVEPFGTWLDSQGFPFGLGIAVGITVLEIIGTPLLALGRFTRYLSLAYAAIYIVGIVLVHAPAGWFVVGLGRNGMEYSVLLIVCLLGLAWHTRPDRTT
jgi:putative oxidoreductase